MNIVVSIIFLLIVLKMLNIRLSKLNPKVSKKFNHLAYTSWKINILDKNPWSKKIILAPLYGVLWLLSLTYLLLIRITKASLKQRKI